MSKKLLIVRKRKEGENQICSELVFFRFSVWHEFYFIKIVMASKCSLLSHKSFYNREVRGRDAKAPAAQLQKHTSLIRQARKDYKGESLCIISGGVFKPTSKA